MLKRRFLTRIAILLLVCMTFGACAASAVEYVCPENFQTYPLSAEKITLTAWYPRASSMGELADFNDSEFFIWLEEKTNIHIEFIVPSANTENDAFQLLFASGDMPDLIFHQPGGSQKYRAGEDKAIDDGYFVDLAAYTDITPNYNAWLDYYPEFRKAAFSDTGKLYGFWGVWLPMYDAFMADQGLAIRKDFLDRVGMDVPVTYDDWYDVLVAFRDQLGIEAPYYSSKWGIDRTGEFMAGFGTAPYFYQVDGVVKYGPLDDAYKEYLTMMNKWWEEGLLDRDFATRTSGGVAADNDMMLNDKIGSLIDYGTRLSDTYITRGATNEAFYLVGVSQPVKQVGDTPAYRDFAAGNDMMTSHCISISADCEYLEEAIRWADSFYAMDVYLNANYGLDEQEGVVWYADPEDGHRIGDYDFRFNNPDGTSSATVVVLYWMKSPPVFMEAAQIEQADENKQAAYKVWATYAPDNWISNRITMTSEEGTEYASLYADIETYVQECNVKFIMGQMSLDDYDSYRDTLRKMNIDRCIELRQAALDRYNAR